MKANRNKPTVFSRTEKRKTSSLTGGAGRAAFLLILLCLALTGCRKESLYATDPRSNFEALWKILDEHYCFFEYKDVDWDEVYRTYSAQLSDTLNRYQLFEFLGNMLSELKDGHTNLVSSFNMARYWAWYENYPPNFNYEIQKNYLGTDYLISGGIRYVRLPGTDVGYLYYGSFSNTVKESGLDEIFMYFKDCRGLIIDVRDNGGGSLSYSDRIASRFLEEKVTVGYIRHKTGPGHDDFSDLYPIELKPSERARWLRPVAVLTNRHSYSATNDFVNKMKILPRVAIIGDRTGGGSGLPFNSELPNGWIVRFSASPILDVNKEITESGIEPDLKVDMTAEDTAKGRDTLIEEAVTWIHAQTRQPAP
ncbi:MAG: S41 family peptidase [Tannerella sp.]|jgi:C-terminal processing protease CtpA/Prc|nr:S41 family peptidase [Tannerella sp.]